MRLFQSRSILPLAILSLISFSTPVSFAQTAPSPSAEAPATLSTFEDVLDGVLSVYSSEYAPLNWKQKTVGLSVDRIERIARNDVRNDPNMSTSEFHKVLFTALNGMKDYHVSVSFDRTERSQLPLTLWWSNDRFVIAYIDRALLPQSSFPFEVGDEVVSFDGRNIKDVAYDLRSEVGSGNHLSTDKLLTARRITNRLAARGMTVPQGEVSMGIRSGNSSSVKNVSLNWIYTPETVDPDKVSGVAAPIAAVNTGKIRKDLSGLTAQSQVEETKAEQAVFKDAVNPFVLGGKVSYVPQLGEVIWRSAANSLYDAYIFKTSDGKKAGYLRLNTYSYDVNFFYLIAHAEFGSVLRKFEKETDKLVLDQINNPGGSVFFMYGLGSYFAKQPLKMPKHQEVLRPEDISSPELIAMLEEVTTDAEAIALFGSSTIHGYPVNVKFAHEYGSYLKFQASEFSQGKGVSDPFPLYGAAEVLPKATGIYSKPVLLLVNDLDFSGGDFFPAMMQDNKRMTLLGTTTAGAGGYIHENKVANTVGVDHFISTSSIAWRTPTKPIENLGVTPDIEYAISVSDLKNGFVGYKAKILQSLSNLR